MNKQRLISGLVALLWASAAWADYVTVHNTVGLLDTELMTKDFAPVGSVEVWNTPDEVKLVITPDEGFVLDKVLVYLDTVPAPARYDEDGNPVCVEPDFGEWPYSEKFKKNPPTTYTLTVKLEDIEGLEWGQWGEKWLQERLLTIAAKVTLKPKADKIENFPSTFTAWAINTYVPLDLQRTAWGDNAYAFQYELQHPKHGQFVDAPVIGLDYLTWTQQGQTGTDGGFLYFPGEKVRFFIGGYDLGVAVAAPRISPLDIFTNADLTSPQVANMARLLQSLDADGEPNGAINITGGSVAALQAAMGQLGFDAFDFYDDAQIEAIILAAVSYGNDEGLPLVVVSAADAIARLELIAGNSLIRRNISKSPEYAVDKPKLDIVPIWVPARTASGVWTNVDYRDEAGNLIESRNMAKPLLVTYTEKQEPNPAAGITRSGSDIITAISLDDGATWKRFNVSHMARRSSFMLETGERYPGDSRGPQQKIAEDKLFIVWTSAFARGGKPSVAIRTDDSYPYDDAYAVNDVWGVRGRQGSVDYDEDKDVGDQGIGEIPYYALWACRGVIVWEGNAAKFPGHSYGDVVWFKPERITTGRRDAFFPVASSAKNVGFAVAWQEDPGGLLPGSCKGGGDGWSGATVHKKTDIWYSFIRYNDFDLIDTHYDPSDIEHTADEFGDADDHGEQPEISNRPKWLVPMSLPVRISDNNAVNTENLKVQLDETTGLPVIDSVTGTYIPIVGAEEEDYLATEHEGTGDCDEGDGEDSDHDSSSGTGGGWGMARYAYQLPYLSIADQTETSTIWDHSYLGDFRPENPSDRWYRFVNKPGYPKTVVVTPDGRPLDGDTGACRPMLTLMPGGWALLGYEETKGLGEPPEGDHEDVDEQLDRPEPDDSGKNIVYHSFKFDIPDLVSSGQVLNLPAVDDTGDLIPIYYKDANGDSTGIFRQYKTENARRIRFIAQPKAWMGSSRTVLFAVYKQGREGSGKPSDVFAIRGVVPFTDTNADNPYRFSNLIRYDTGAESTDPYTIRNRRRHMNMSAATVESYDPFLTASDNEGNTWNKVGKWKQYQGNLTDESFHNPYSDSKAHRGFIRGDRVVFGYSFTPNWGRLGGDHMDFFVRRSFNGGQSWTTDPAAIEDTVHTVIERDPYTGEFSEKQFRYGPGQFEPGRNVSLLKGNSHTITDPRLVPPMGPGTVNPIYPQDDKVDENTYFVAIGTAEVLHGIGEPLGVTDIVKEDIYFTRTTDDGTTWLQVPWDINPDSSSPDAGETVYRLPWLAHGTTQQGHAQLRAHPSGTRLYSIWHQESADDGSMASPHDAGNDIWFRRVDFMVPAE